MTSSPDNGPRTDLSLEVVLCLDGDGEQPLSGTATWTGLPQPVAFGGVLDLLRQLERARDFVNNHTTLRTEEEHGT
jgi:hypothetical protein